MADLFEVSPPVIQSMPDPTSRGGLLLPEPRPRRTPKPEPADEPMPDEEDAIEENPKPQLDVTA